MVKTEREVLRKWNNIRRDNGFSVDDIFRLCKDIMIARAGEHDWKTADAIVLHAPPGSEYDYISLKFETPQQRNKETIWIDSIDKATSLDEDQITSSISVERTFRKGGERFKIFVNLPEIYVPLIKSSVAEEILLNIALDNEEKTTLFHGIKTAFLATVLNENTSSSQSAN